MTPEQERDMKRTVWAYMLENGYETTGEWSIYGGHWEPVGKRGARGTDYIPYLSSVESKNHRAGLVELIREYGGVDWERTQMPESHRQTEFNGTFTENTPCEALLGTLVLANWTEIQIGVSKAETRFHEYAKALAALMEDKARVESIFGK